MTQNHFDSEALTLVLLREGQQLTENFNHRGRQKPLTNTGRCGLALLCYTGCLQHNIHKQLPSPQSLDQDSIPTVLTMLTMPWITGSSERQ